MVDFLPLHKAGVDEICKESLRDHTTQTLQKVIRSSWPEKKSDLLHNVTPYLNMRDKLSVQDGIVFKGDRCVVHRQL